MSGYTELVKLLKKVQASGGLNCDEASICDYQDMIGHSSIEQLKELSNGDYKEAFYRVYCLAYGVIVTLRFYCQNSTKIENVLRERDGYVCDIEDLQDKLNKAKAESDKNLDLFSKAHEGYIKVCQEKDDIQKALNLANDEIVRLKARLFDLMEKRID